MDIRFSGRNFKITEGIKEHIFERISKLDKYAARLIEAHVVLKKTKYIYEAEISLSAKNLHAFGKGNAEDNIYTAIDEAHVKVEKQLKKFREKIKNHHKKKHKSSGKTPKTFKGEGVLADTKPEVLISENFAPKPMSIDEASLQLELSMESFLVFLNSSTNSVNVIHKRDDGKQGLIEPKF